MHPATTDNPVSQWKSIAATRRRFWLPAAAILVMAAVGVYLRMCTGFMPFDDEGYVLIGVRSLLEGKPLYSQVYAQYGPFFYLIQWAIYSLLGQNASPDLERLIAGVMWLLASVLLAYAVYRLTMSLVW